MAKKEAFTPIWNYDDPDEKNGRKKMTIQELDRERGKRDEADPAAVRDFLEKYGGKAETGQGAPEGTEKHYRGMFEEDRIAHKMTKKKEKVIAISVVAAAVIIIVLSIVLTTKWRREAWRRRYLAAPQTSWSAICPAEAQREL